MSSFDASRFKPPVPNDFICSICRGVILSPLQAPCDHLFCSVCISKWLEGRTRSCPLCQSTLTMGQMKTPRIINNLLSNLEVYCKFKEQGCPLLIKYDKKTIDDHEKGCKFQLCSKGCGAYANQRHDCVEHLKSTVQRMADTIATTEMLLEELQQKVEDQETIIEGLSWHLYLRDNSSNSES